MTRYLDALEEGHTGNLLPLQALRLLGEIDVVPQPRLARL